MKPGKLFTLTVLLSICLWDVRAAVINVNYSPTFTFSGPIDGVTLGLINASIPQFEKGLGPLTTSVSIYSELTYSASINAVPTPGLIYHQAFSVLFNTEMNYGISASPTIYGGSSVCKDANGCPAMTFPPYFLFPASQFGTVVNPQVSGGVIPVRVQGTVTPGMSTATGSWTLTGQAQIQESYTPLSRQDYIRQALAGTTGSDAQRANQAYEKIIELRGTSAATSSQNLNLRDAEYWLRGYAGGRSIGSLPVDFSTLEGAFHDMANRTGPVATGIYNGKKYLNEFLGRNTAGPDELPNSPVGGFSENLSGWINGTKRVPLDEAVDAIASPPLPGSLSRNAPTVPDLSLQSSNGQLSVYNTNIQRSGDTVYFDPISGKYVTFGVVGNRFSGFELVTPFDLGSVFIHVDNQVIALSAGTYLDFLTLNPDGVDGFFLSGLPKSALDGFNFTFGASFMFAGDTLTVVTSGDFETIAAVPEPPAIALWMLALAILLFQRRRRSIRRN